MPLSPINRQLIKQIHIIKWFKIRCLHMLLINDINSFKYLSWVSVTYIQGVIMKDLERTGRGWEVEAVRM